MDTRDEHGGIWPDNGFKYVSSLSSCPAVHGTYQNVGNALGFILTYNLSRSFTSTTNTTGILVTDPISKAAGGAELNGGAIPFYFDGALLANDDSFFLYGGSPSLDAMYPLPPGDNVQAYEAYSYGLNKPLFSKGFLDTTTNNAEVTRYIAYGAAVNAPSENLAWYFSGLRAPDAGPIYYNSINLSSTAAEASNTLITLNMTTQYQQTWSNKTLPAGIAGRANPSAVWVPVGKQGIVVVVGGVTCPEWSNPNGTDISTDPAASVSHSFSLALLE